MNKPSTVSWARGVCALGVLAVAVIAFAATMSPVARALRRGDTVTGIIMGTDLADHAPHSDTLIVVHYHPRQGRLDLISIPRDTKIDLHGFRFRRINEVFAYHYAQTHDASLAAERTGEAVTSLFARCGVTLVPTFFVQVDFDGFRRVIDRWGGVTLTVDEPMDYDDNAGRFHVHLATGVHHLNGSDALGYVRFRGRSGDRGRILRQMEFVRAVSKRMMSPEMAWRGPGLLGEAVGAVTTNLSPWDVVFLALEARRVPAQRMNTILLPGHPRGAVWDMDEERTGYLLRRLEPDASSPDDPRAEPGGLPSGPASEKEPSPAITVKVWNASGTPGLAIAVTRRLRAAGFDVVEWGNYATRQKKSRAIDRSGHFERASAVAQALGVSSLYSDADPGLRTDVDVVLGDDYKPGADPWK